MGVSNKLCPAHTTRPAPNLSLLIKEIEGADKENDTNINYPFQHFAMLKQLVDTYWKKLFV